MASTSVETPSVSDSRMYSWRRSLAHLPGRDQKLDGLKPFRFGRLDVLFTNAGGPPSGGFDDFAAEDYEQALRLNLLSVVHLCRAAVPIMREQRHGRIVALTSISVKQPVDGLLLSNTARAGAQGFLKSLANEVARDGITVNNVCPGYTDTERLRSLATSLAASRQYTEDEIRAVFRRYVEVRERIDRGELPWTALEEFFTEDAVFCDPAWGRVEGLANLKTFWAESMAGLEDWSFPEAWTLVEGDRVVTMWWQRMGHRPDGGHFECPGLSVLHYAGDGKFEGEEVSGVRMVMSSNDYDASRAAVAMLIETYAASGDRWEWRTAHFDRLAGTDALRLGLEAGSGIDELTASWTDDLDAFEELRAPYLIY